jgi:hypothetical protein
MAGEFMTGCPRGPGSGTGPLVAFESAAKLAEGEEDKGDMGGVVKIGAHGDAERREVETPLFRVVTAVGVPGTGCRERGHGIRCACFCRHIEAGRADSRSSRARGRGPCDRCFQRGRMLYMSKSRQS